jgi:hypothetical protein
MVRAFVFFFFSNMRVFPFKSKQKLANWDQAEEEESVL